MQLYPWQVPHADKLEQALRTYGVALDGSDLGTGKTVVAAEVVRRGGGQVFVVCPKAVVPAWVRTLEAFGITPIGVVNYEKLKMGNTPFGKWEKRKWVWSLPAGTLIIWDEARRCFPANTRVETPAGGVPIQSLQPGDWVLTPLGPRRVLSTQITPAPKRLLEITHSQGRLVCTDDHPLFIDRVGFRPASTINPKTHALISTTQESVRSLPGRLHAQPETAAFLQQELQHETPHGGPARPGRDNSQNNRHFQHPRISGGPGEEGNRAVGASENTRSLPELSEDLPPKEKEAVLLSKLQRQASVQPVPRTTATSVQRHEESDGRPKPPDPEGSRAVTESGAIPDTGPINKSNQPRSEEGSPLPSQARRERARADQTSGATPLDVGAGVGGRSVPMGTPSQHGLANHAGGLVQQGNKSSDRSRWELPQDSGRPSPRPKEGSPTPRTGVGRPSSHQRRGVLDPALRFIQCPVASVRDIGPSPTPLYDIEVEEAHCFFAEGVLAHNCKGTDTKNALMLKDSTDYPLLLLSATLAESPLDLRAVAHVTGLAPWSKFINWLFRVGCRKAQFGGLHLPAHARESALSYLHEELFQKRGSRIRIAELGDKFPETQITAEAFDLGDPDEIQKIYDEMEAELDALTDAMSGDKPGNPLTIQLRARQRVELLKVPGVAALAQNYVDEGASVAIFTNFRDTLDALKERLKTNCAVYGGQKPGEREAAISAFQADESRTIIVNIQAGGEGISLHDTHGNHPRVALIFPTYEADKLRQATGRVRRSGGMSKSIQRILFAAGTVEERVCKKVQAKLANIDLLNDGDLSFSENNLNESTAPVSIPPSSDLSNSLQMPSTDTATPTKEPQPQERAHSRHSPSSLLYKAKCSGWVNDNSPGRDTNAADRGTLGHEMIERRNFDLAPEDEPLTKAARKCAEFLDGMSARMTRALGLPTTEHKEFKVKVLDQFGHVDHLFICGSEGRMVDYKFAHSDTYAADSPQFWAYGIGVFDKFPEIQTLHVYVLLPFRDEVDKVVWTREKDYARLVGLVGGIISNAKNPDPSRYVIGKHCTYCGRLAEGKCVKFVELGTEIAAKYDAEKAKYALPENLETAHGSLIDNPETLARLYRLAGLVEKAAEGWKRATLEKRLAGVDIPGFDLAERRGKREITSAVAAFEAVKERVPAETLLEAAKLSIGALEDLWAQTFPRGQKSGSKQLLMEALIDADAVSSGAPVQFLRETA